MKKQKISVTLIFPLLMLITACSPAATLVPTRTGTGSTDAVQPTHPPENPTSTPLPAPAVIQLPASARLGAVLTGSGAVNRSLLTYDDLMTGAASAPVDDGAFSLPEQAAMPGVDFEGRLQIPATTDAGAELIRGDQSNTAARLQLPAFDLQFVQDGSFLIPVTQGLVFTGDPYWNYIVGPGRIWMEDGDHGVARASFPFALVERNQNCTHNGVMTFLFDGTQISRVRYQITQETCLYFKFNLWGQAAATYTPESIPQADVIKDAHAAELLSRLPTRPIEALESDFPEAQINLARFGAGITPAHMTAYGLVIHEVNYVSGCRTRFGEYAYCESMRLPSYSTAKSAFAAVALMRLGQKFGTDVYKLLVKNHVPEAAEASGDWSAVTFGNALDMSTGNYESTGYMVDEDNAAMNGFINGEPYSDKNQFAFSFPNQKSPGEVWIYHTSDTFIATLAMNNYLENKEGEGADIFDFLRDEVLIPLHVSAGTLSTLRTDNNPGGMPFGGYGLFWTQDDIAKVALFLNDLNGSIDGTPVLEPGLLAASLQRDPNDRGLNTSGLPVFKYRNGFWAREWTKSENRRYTCSFWTPFMSGYGGITVVLIPNGSVYYYFSDNNEFSWYDAVNESNKLISICP